MAVSASPSTWSPLSVPPICRVFVSGTTATSADGKRKEVRRQSGRDLSKVTWVHEPRLQVSGWNLESGAAAHSCTIIVPGNSGASTPLVTDFGLVWGVDTTNDGEKLGVVMRPDGIYWWDDIMVMAYAPDDTDQSEPVGTCVFRGVVADVWEDLASGVPGFTALGPRFLLEGARLHGANVWDDRNDCYVWVPEILPVFNDDGTADMADDSKVEESMDAAAQGDAAKKALEPAFTHVGGVSGLSWTRGKVWNYIRKHWQVSPKGSVVLPLSGWLDIIELSSEGTGAALFNVTDTYDGISKYENRRLSMALHGKRLNTALAHLARHSSDHDITVRPGDDKSTLLLYGTGSSTIESVQRRLSLRRGEIGRAVNASTTLGGRPEITGGRLGYSVRNSYTRVRYYGARKELDLTIDTVAGSLVEGWLSADQTTYNSADRDNDDAMVTPSVYRRYVIADTVDWVGDYAFAIHLLRAGALGATLASGDTGTASASGRLVRVRAQAWYSTDGGSTWTDVKSPFVVQTKSLAVEFPHSARYGNKTRFTWNGNRGSASSYDLRVTVKVTLDERLMVTAGEEPAGWPARELIRVDENYRYRARRNCRIRTDNGKPPDDSLSPGDVVLDGGTMCNPAAGAVSGGAADDDVIRDDTEYLNAAANALHSQLSRPALNGEIVLRGVRLDIWPGDYIEKIVGGGGAGATGVKRTDWPVRAVVRAVRVSVAAQETTLVLEID